VVEIAVNGYSVIVVTQSGRIFGWGVSDFGLFLTYSTFDEYLAPVEGFF
jgi:hypothetical protein